MPDQPSPVPLPPLPAPAAAAPASLQLPVDHTVAPRFPGAPRCSEVRARRVGSGWLVYIDGQEMEVCTDSTLGAMVSALVARK